MTLIFALLLALPWQFGTLDGPPAKAKQWVSYTSEQQSVSAGKQSMLELRFQVSDGFHVNSHTPKSELLIPTRVALEPAAGVKMGDANYPAGKEYSFSFDPKEKLDVYAQEFVVSVPVEAKPGTHEIAGALRYQACDKAACYPPKTLPLRVIFTAK